MNDTNNGLVYIVDDDEAMRDALETMLTSVGQSCRSFPSAREFLAGFDPEQPGCLLLDLRMPEQGGLALQDALQARGCELPIIMISAYASVSSAVRAMRRGAVDFFEKPIDHDRLLVRINECLGLSRKRYEEQQHFGLVREVLENLTAREKEVLKGVVNGDSSKVIATNLGLSARTVDVHRSNIMRKLGVHSSSKLVGLVIKAQSVLDTDANGEPDGQPAR